VRVSRLPQLLHTGKLHPSNRQPTDKCFVDSTLVCSHGQSHSTAHLDPVGPVQSEIPVLQMIAICIQGCVHWFQQPDKSSSAAQLALASIANWQYLANFSFFGSEIRAM
jgi:hypothetical protein